MIWFNNVWQHAAGHVIGTLITSLFVLGFGFAVGKAVFQPSANECVPIHLAVAMHSENVD